ncbi:MAG: amidase, partial [Chromatiales bacterium]|nr:amidase [Chromatiales bacterium]
MADLAFRSAAELARLIRCKEVGCVELLDVYLERVDRFNPELNAIVVRDVEAARERAKQADAAASKGDWWGPLHGVPMTIKESYDVVGMPTTWGVPAHKDNFPSANALSVDRLLDAGVVLFGKTNVPVHLADWQSFNAIYGTTNNPWDLKRGPGGSSGGSAAALAAGLTGLDAGSDIGASIRNPAHYCGVYGHKPTYGVVSPRGQALPGKFSTADISVIGPMARSADDLALALGVMSGPDLIDGVGWQLSLPPADRVGLRDYKVGVMYTDEQAEVDEEVQQVLRKLVACLIDAGVDVDENARPEFNMGQAHRNYIQLLRAATSSRMNDREMERNGTALASLAADAMDYGAQAIRAQAMSHRDWLIADNERHRMRLEWARFFDAYDLLLCPTATTTAFEHNQEGDRQDRMVTVNGSPQPSTTQMFWSGLSCNFYLPSTVAPAGL